MDIKQNPFPTKGLNSYYLPGNSVINQHFTAFPTNDQMDSLCALVVVFLNEGVLHLPLPCVDAVAVVTTE